MHAVNWGREVKMEQSEIEQGKYVFRSKRYRIELKTFALQRTVSITET